MAETMHRDCVACLAQDDERPEVPVLVVLRMLLGAGPVDPVPLRQVVDDLCPPHRERLGVQRPLLQSVT